MSVRQDKRGKVRHWYYRKVVTLPDGRRARIFGVPQIKTRAAAEAAEREGLERVLREGEHRAARKQEAPTLEEWFNGRVWKGHVLGGRRPCSPGEQANKKSVWKYHLGPRFGGVRIDRIGREAIDEFRGALKAAGAL